jgi:hypothetical protein
MTHVLGVTYSPETREQKNLTVLVGGMAHPKSGESVALLTVKAKNDDVVELWLTREQTRALGIWLIEAGGHLEKFPHGMVVGPGGAVSKIPPRSRRTKAQPKR